MFQLLEQGHLRTRADAGLHQQGRGVGVRLEFVGTAEAGGQQRHQRIADQRADAGQEPVQHHRDRGPHRVLGGEIRHPPPGMTQRHVPQFMRDDAGQFLGRDLARAVAVEESARDEDASVGGRQPVDHRHFVDVDADPVEVERAGHPVGQRLQLRIGEFRRRAVQFAPRAPGREVIQRQRIGDRKQKGCKFQHDTHMGALARDCQGSALILPQPCGVTMRHESVTPKGGR